MRTQRYNDCRREAFRGSDYRQAIEDLRGLRQAARTAESPRLVEQLNRRYIELCGSIAKQFTVPTDIVSYDSFVIGGPFESDRLQPHTPAIRSTDCMF